jgi:uncharacterized protein (TIGR03382 family)
MKTFVAIAAAAGCAAAASAGTFQEVQVQSFGPQAPDFTTGLVFNQFTGNLADLTSIEVIVDLSVDGGSASVDNDGETSTMVDIEFGTSVSISSMDVSLLDGSFDPVSAGVSVLTNPSLSLDANDGDDITQFDAGGPDFATVMGLAGSDNDSGFINTMFFADYVGGGMFTIDVDANTEFSISGGSAVQGSFVNQTASGSVTVIYNFIPAPGAVALFGLGGLAAARRRR